GAVQGAAPLRLVGNTAVTMSATGTVAKLEIAKTNANYYLQVPSDLMITGDLILTSGALYITGAGTILTIGGNVLLQGGLVSSAGATELHVIGTLTYAGSQTSATPPT